MLQRISLLVKINQLSLLRKITLDHPLASVIPLPGYRGFFITQNQLLISFNPRQSPFWTHFKTITLLPSWLDIPLFLTKFERNPFIYYFFEEKKGNLRIYDRLWKNYAYFGKFTVDLSQIYSIKDLPIIPHLPNCLMQRAKKKSYFYGDALYLALNSKPHFALFSKKKKSLKEIYLTLLNKALKKFCD
jgi:hypothetical protein